MYEAMPFIRLFFKVLTSAGQKDAKDATTRYNFLRWYDSNIMAPELLCLCVSTFLFSAACQRVYNRTKLITLAPHNYHLQKDYCDNLKFCDLLWIHLARIHC